MRLKCIRSSNILDEIFIIKYVLQNYNNEKQYLYFEKNGTFSLNKYCGDVIFGQNGKIRILKIHIMYK